jgi:ribosome-associated toxin RatA of RatAB toxin-antitoxin module
MRSTVGIDVAAPPETVFRLARNVERWPRLLPHYVAATRLGAADRDGRLWVRFVAIRPLVPLVGLGIPVTWRSLTWSDEAAGRLRFRHRGGATNGMDVTWRIEARPEGGCRVDIEHDFRPRVPGWAWLVDRLFTRPVAGRTLATFRALAEAVGEADESAAGSPTNSPA